MKDNKASIANDAVVLTTAKIVTTLIGLLSSMLLARFRTLEEYGTYSQILLVVNLAVSLFTLGLPNSMNYFLVHSETGGERKHFLSVYYTLNTVLCLAIGVVLWVCLPFLESYFQNRNLSEFWFILSVLPWTKVMISGVSNLLVVYGKTGKLRVFNIINSLIVLVAILIVKVFELSFRSYMIFFLAGEVCMALWVYRIIWNMEGGLTCSFDKTLILTILQYSIPLGLSGLVGTLTIETDKLMIGRLLDTEMLAIYTNASKELPFSIVASSLTAVLLPQIARKLKAKESDEAVALWGEVVEISYMILSFAVAVLIVFAPQIMTALYTEKYISGVGIFRIYSLVLLLRTTYFGMLLSSAAKTKLIFVSSVITLVMNIILNLLLYSVMGVEGPALATFLSIAIAACLQLVASARLLHIPFRKIFPWWKLWKHTAINLAWSIPMYAIIRVLKLGVGVLDISVAIGLIIAAFIVYAFAERKYIILVINLLKGKKKNAD